MPTSDVAPKLFISYSWSNPDHEQWVDQLAKSLVESGVDVVFDKWDLRVGHDTIKFMESLVTDPDIKKVIMICDEVYAAKADGRNGGVGTETQIISKNVYQAAAQDKFVAVLPTRDDHGKPYLPTYYSSRIYIDLSDENRYASEFERLLRWIFDKPLHVKPQLGKRPEFLNEGNSVSLGTSAIYRRCIDALKQGKSFSSGALDEYLSTFADNLERFKLDGTDGEPDDAVVESIEKFLPHRDEFAALAKAIAQYGTTTEYGQKVHRFLERVHAYTKPPVATGSYYSWQFDNFKFIVHELFLYSLAIFLRYDRFDLANILLEQPYYIRADETRVASSAASYADLHQTITCFEQRKRRLKSNRISLHADMLKQRVFADLDFGYLMQADFVAFMRAELATNGHWNPWWPETLVYVDRFAGPFEIFARSASSTYFDKAKIVLGVTEKVEIEHMLAQYKQGRRTPQFGWVALDPAALLGGADLCSRR